MPSHKTQQKEEKADIKNLRTFGESADKGAYEIIGRLCKHGP